jgi:hypothetical protein
LYLIGELNYDFVSGKVAILSIEFQGNHGANQVGIRAVGLPGRCNDFEPEELMA